MLTPLGELIRKAGRQLPLSGELVCRSQQSGPALGEVLFNSRSSERRLAKLGGV
ncbi:MAG: hypothetical protein WDO56_12205 [Gammaproteobacteria bacterium]